MSFVKKLLILFIAVNIAENNKSDALKVLGIFPMQGTSHYVIGEQLMKALVQRGHQVDVVSHFPQKKQVTNFTDISLAGTLPGIINNITIDQTDNIHVFSILNFVKHVGNEPCELLSTHQGLQALLKKPKKSYDVVIVGIFGAHCYIGFGQHFDAPVVGLLPSNMHDWLYGPFGIPLNTAYMGSFFSYSSQEMTFYERLVNTVVSGLLILQFNYGITAQFAQYEKHFGRKLNSIQEIYDDISVLLVNSHHSIGEIRPQTPDVVDVGGLHVRVQPELPADIKKWLDDSTEGCVCISFGSMVRLETLPADKLEAFYEMFRRIAPVRVIMKITDPKLLPPDLPKNVMTSTWLPQAGVLQHKNTKAFVTHGGLLGTQEAIAAGVPLVGIPIFGDQYTNIQTYARKKIAVVLNLQTIDADSLTSAVQTVLTDPEYRKNIADVSALFMDRPMSPKDTAVYWVEYAARRGNRLKSPGTKLYWWQFYLLDVYGFMLGALILVLFIIKKTLASIFGICLSRITSVKVIEAKKNQ